ncbi:MAG: ASKHA domain-containing protein [Desulfitobacteriaceae bacterium]|nr:ASKHA domain-containing protein [Desulfitobacteriaceae bacterium]MDI6879420.1 ASKHA domain-containing protein [Desulfitobacteriaceae bacterium]MDI6914698.1 ASKHA domain-containing protein [Desulfitobacteriaceae bacterium]
MSNPDQAPILLEQTLTPLSELDPLTRKVLVQLPPRATADNRADVDSVRHVLEQQVGPMQIPLSLMHSIPALCSTREPLTATLAPTGCCWQLIELEQGDTTEEHYGLAVDIGTTTIVVYLIDMHSGAVLQRAADFNGQIPFGEDILSRIRHAAEPSGLIELQHAIRDTLNRLIDRVCIPPLTPTRISAVSIGANTTMVHLLLGLDPVSISRSPYIPVVNAPGILTAQDIGLGINPLAPVYCLPSVGSFIGGDIIAGVLVSSMHLQDEISLFVDIGTNGEIVMGNREWLVACAGAAGPALEGGVTTHGMRAEAGAVDRVSLDPVSGEVRYSTIGQTPACGICGSGLVDILAELFLHEIIDRAAHFATGQSHFIVVPAAESTTGQDIIVTQADIDNLMATKGAVNAALDVLLESVGCSWQDIHRFYAAGAFGQYLPLESAITIGLYPDLPRSSMIRLGNSSGEGARQVLLSQAKRKEAETLAATITYFELNANPTFMDKFKSSKFLPHTDIDRYPSVKARLQARRTAAQSGQRA